MKTPRINDKYLCKKYYIMDDERIAYKYNKIYTIKETRPDGSFNMPSELFDHKMYFDNEFKEHFELVEKTYQLSETFVKELIKEPNIKEAFIREGIIDETKEKQTAVEWLAEQFEKIVFYSEEAKEDTIKQAKEMEKQQIIEAYKTFLDTTLSNEVYEEHYNETFKK